MLLLPGAIIALIGAHMYLVVKLGTTAPPWMKADKPKVAAPVAQLDAGVEGNGASPSNGGSAGA
jgi:quinol-cytochrome oxidoreductase complex cytochrome b subunit